MNWRGDKKFPASFIFFFVLVFFLLGEQLPALPTYLLGPAHSGGGELKLHILDLPVTDALHHPLFYVLFATFNWVLFRFFPWPIVWLIGGTLWTLDQWFWVPPDHRPMVSGFFPSLRVTLGSYILWGVLTLVPYFLYRWIDRKWSIAGRRKAIIIATAINLILFGFFAIQIFVLHHSYRVLNGPPHPVENQLSQTSDSPKQSATPIFSSVAPTNNSLNQTDQRLAILPDLQSFETQKTDQFLVDMDVVATGHPFKGKRALDPHAGAHIHFGDDYKTWPRGGSEPNNYPPIYAAASGVIDMVDDKVNVGANDRYGVSLAIAKDGNAIWDLDYSIEPMVAEPSADFYKPFITVKKGDRVTKGQIIAYMYLPTVANGTHIHFHLRKSGHEGFYAPAIFSDAVVQAFHDHWGNFGIDGGQTAIPLCLGWKLAAEENPFSNEEVDCLK